MEECHTVVQGQYFVRKLIFYILKMHQNQSKIDQNQGKMRQNQGKMDQNQGKMDQNQGKMNQNQAEMELFMKPTFGFCNPEVFRFEKSISEKWNFGTHHLAYTTSVWHKTMQMSAVQN